MSSGTLFKAMNSPRFDSPPFNMMKGRVRCSTSIEVLQVCLGVQVLVCLLHLSVCTYSLPALQGISSPNCNYTLQTCGSLSIPYPFGMSPGCGLPEYRISCKLNASYGDGELAFLQIGTPSTPDLQVLVFSTRTIIVNSTLLKAMPSPQNCNTDVYGNATLELAQNGPFILSENNWFVVTGCDSEGSCTAETTDGKNTIISCRTSCYNQHDMAFCNSYACCINTLPPGSYRIDFKGRGINYKDYPDVCGFATVLSPATYTVSREENGKFGAGEYGLSIQWALQLLDNGQNCTTAKQRPDYACSVAAECLDDDTLHGYTCNCTSGYRGDGYQAGLGCKDIDECEENLDVCEKPPLGSCTNTEGSYKCSCAGGGAGSGLPGTCPIINHNANLLLPVLLGGLAGAASLAVILAVAFTSIRAYKKRRERAENFRRSGGDQVKVELFSEKALMIATNGFSNDHKLGEGGFGIVYWGEVDFAERGNMKVAIKTAKPKAVEEQLIQMHSFVQEMLLLSQTDHDNIVQLLGCCVETLVPLLVFECVENGTLEDYLTQKRDDARIIRKETAGFEFRLWAWRLHIAAQTAEALSYMHTKSEPIFHLDMKSANILIDVEYNPKVADFGLSCFLTSDATHLTNHSPAGTRGYVDPEYVQSFCITDKCDVYSFGVIMLELISSRPANPRIGPFLAHHFRTVVNMEHEISEHLRGCPSFVDIRLGNDVDVIASVLDVAKLAHRCVALTGTERPSMQEVVGELKKIQAKNAGKLVFKGSIHASPHAKQELMVGANVNESDGAPLFDYNWIPSDQSTSTSSLFPPTRTSSTIELQSF